jgi:hypothetical protein
LPIPHSLDRIRIIWTHQFICPSWTNCFLCHRFNINILGRLRCKAGYLLTLFDKDKDVRKASIQDCCSFFLFGHQMWTGPCDVWSRP